MKAAKFKSFEDEKPTKAGIYFLLLKYGGPIDRYHVARWDGERFDVRLLSWQKIIGWLSVDEIEPPAGRQEVKNTSPRRP